MKNEPNTPEKPEEIVEIVEQSEEWTGELAIDPLIVHRIIEANDLIEHMEEQNEL
jgi:D-tyrosyl-tRNA(Tyr) deacylase